jgi:hypothetical protein
MHAWFGCLLMYFGINECRICDFLAFDVFTRISQPRLVAVFKEKDRSCSVRVGPVFIPLQALRIRHGRARLDLEPAQDLLNGRLDSIQRQQGRPTSC